MSRELDIKVAEAMGWKLCDNGRRDYWVSPTMGKMPLPNYSIDYAALPEMLTWLRGGFKIDRWLPLHGSHAWSASMHAFHCEAYGDTLPEAVARLVVAVAEAKR